MLRVCEMQIQAKVGAKAEFQQFDVSQPLSEQDDTFDAVFSNDVLCHVQHRSQVFANVFHILKPGARFVFSDALVIGGLVSHEEIATRSSIGMYFFSTTLTSEPRLLRFLYVMEK